MEIQQINKELIESLLIQAGLSDRKRQAFDLRTTPDDQSQRMLNALEVGTVVPIHRHEESSETNICISGRLDVIFYEELPNMDAEAQEEISKNSSAQSFAPQRGIMVYRFPWGYGIPLRSKSLHVYLRGKMAHIKVNGSRFIVNC